LRNLNADHDAKRKEGGRHRLRLRDAQQVLDGLLRESRRSLPRRLRVLEKIGEAGYGVYVNQYGGGGGSRFSRSLIIACRTAPVATR
jgi:hypothetical protein